MRWVTVAACLATTTATATAATPVRVYGTSDTTDSLLVPNLIEPGFEAAHPEYDLQYTAVGTGAALQAGKDGKADAVLTHAPTSEAQFYKDNFTQGLGRQIFYSDYVIIGPKSDPARVKADHAHDAVGAFEAIAAAGATPGSKVSFRSRNNSSGTNVQEEIIWGLSNVSPKAKSENAGSDPTRFEPCAAPAPNTGCPSWYVRIANNPNQATTVTSTETCNANGNFCYTMVDRGTFNRFKNQVGDPIPNLELLSDLNNGPGARGGNDLQVNPFNVYVMNPDRSYPGGQPINTAAARVFVDYLTSPALQAQLRSFPNSIQPAFFEDAAPALTVSSPPAAVTAGSPLTITGTVRNQLPGAGTIAGVPIKLVTGDAAPFTDTGVSTTSGNDGSFSLTTTVNARSHYQLVTGTSPVANTTPVTGVSSYTSVLGTTKDVGVVDATRAAASTPPGTTPAPDFTVPPGKSPGSAIKDDGKGPRITKVTLGARRLAFTVNEAATIKVSIYRGKKRLRKLTFDSGSKERIVFRKRAAGSSAGRFRVVFVATDYTGNKRTVTKRFRRR